MPGHNFRVVRDLAKLAGRKPETSSLPAVENSDKPAERKARKRNGDLTPEVLEFMTLPRHIQRQVLDYARRWINANFEAKT